MPVRWETITKIGSAPNAAKPKPAGEEKPTGEKNPGNIGLRNRIAPPGLRSFTLSIKTFAHRSLAGSPARVGVSGGPPPSKQFGGGDDAPNALGSSIGFRCLKHRKPPNTPFPVKLPVGKIHYIEVT